MSSLSYNIRLLALKAPDIKWPFFVCHVVIIGITCFWHWITYELFKWKNIQELSQCSVQWALEIILFNRIAFASKEIKSTLYVMYANIANISSLES